MFRSDKFDRVLSGAGVSSVNIEYCPSDHGKKCPYWCLEIRFCDQRENIVMEVRDESFAVMEERVAERLKG